MHALHDVVQAGHVRYIGMSSCRAYQCKFSCDGMDLCWSTNSGQSMLCKVWIDHPIIERADTCHKTMPSQINSHRSYQCRTIIVWSTEKKNGKWCQLSKLVLKYVQRIHVWYIYEDVRGWFYPMVAIRSWTVESPVGRSDLKTSVDWQVHNLAWYVCIISNHPLHNIGYWNPMLL